MLWANNRNSTGSAWLDHMSHLQEVTQAISEQVCWKTILNELLTNETLAENARRQQTTYLKKVGRHTNQTTRGHRDSKFTRSAARPVTRVSLHKQRTTEANSTPMAVVVYISERQFERHPWQSKQCYQNQHSARNLAHIHAPTVRYIPCCITEDVNKCGSRTQGERIDEDSGH